MDGWAEAPAGNQNAISQARTPSFDALKRDYPYATLGAAGLDVGLPAGQMGNSEVGHLNIGAGRVVYQDLTRVSQAIEDGSFFSNHALTEACRKASQDGGRLHIFGLLSDGGVHSHENHIYAMAEMGKRLGVAEIFLHVFLDGRDVPPDSGATYIDRLEGKLKQLGRGRIATVSGRYYAMDRDNRWDRIKLAYEAIALGKGDIAVSAAEAVRNSYDAEVYDEFVKPAVVVSDLFEEDKPLIRGTDSVVFMNFRPDRSRELSRAFLESGFSGFDRGPEPAMPFFVTLTEYDAAFASPIAFPPETIPNTLATVISGAGKRQLHAAETEKYAHVTFFFNGGVEKPVEGEDRILIPSPRVATYDLKPEMSAFEVAAKTVEAINDGRYDFIVVNFANADMVGHTAIKPAVIKAVEAVDACLGELRKAVEQAGGALLVTADHGNADQLEDGEGGAPFTAHTTNRVPLILAAPGCGCVRQDGKLADIAPTVLELMAISRPTEMTGSSLIC
jgi:2,3-bisphosphoglycerate-independent phosphoglycerate mutase